MVSAAPGMPTRRGTPMTERLYCIYKVLGVTDRMRYYRGGMNTAMNEWR